MGPFSENTEFFFFSACERSQSSDSIGSSMPHPCSGRTGQKATYINTEETFQTNVAYVMLHWGFSCSRIWPLIEQCQQYCSGDFYMLVLIFFIETKIKSIFLLSCHQASLCKILGLFEKKNTKKTAEEFARP